ncbi:PREDICTED: non-specific lipid-transfer protein 1-like [Nelumbo nucifera]|nr:PREDICTED: non-specific lipid-transfer protein 1-like [Nelumbo nucifera]
MASSAVVSKLALAVALLSLLMVAAPDHADAAMTCGQVASLLTPCINYFVKGGALPPACCGAVRGLITASKTTADRQAVCSCFKSAAASIPGVNLGLANSIPGRCGVQFTYKISPSTDCSRIR